MTPVRRLVLLLPAALLLAGCTTTPSPVVTSASTAPEPVPVPTPSIAAVVAPRHQPDEIARAVITADRNEGAIGTVPAGTRHLTVRLACAGPAGKRVRFVLQDAKGGTFAGGDAPCDGEEAVVQLEQMPFPARAGVQLEGGSAVTSAWAVLTASKA
jgi:hypothetical protein